MRRWFATSAVCLLIVLTVSLRPVMTEPPTVDALAAQVEPIPAYHLICPPLYACASVYYQVVGEPFYGAFQRFAHMPFCLHEVCTTMYKRLLFKRFPWVFILPMLALSALPTPAQTPVSLCVIGDSSTDSYQADDNRGGAYHAVSFAWYEQIARWRSIDPGAWAAYADARRTDYAHNASRTGATASWIGGWGNGTIASLNLTGIITERIAAGECDVVVYSIGANDYAPYFEGGYGWVYNGTITPQVRAQNVIDALNTSITALYAADPTTQIVIVKVPDLNNTPLAPVSTYPDPAKRALVSQSINIVNTWIDSVDANAAGAVAVDTLALFTNGDIPLSGGYWNIVNPPMYFWSLNDNPALGGFLAAPDGHGGTLFECKIANLILRGMNTLITNDVPEFSDAECLQHAGLSSTPTNTPAPPTVTSPPTATSTATPSPTNTLVPTPTITNTPVPALTNTPTPVPTADTPPYIIIHRPGVADTIYYLPPGYARVSGYCSSGNAYMGIKEPGATLRKYVCWSE